MGDAHTPATQYRVIVVPKARGGGGPARTTRPRRDPVKRYLAAFSAAVLLVAAMAPVAMAKTTRVAVCHSHSDAAAVTNALLTASDNTVAKHVAHGDTLPGEAVPIMDGYTFDDGCVPVAYVAETIFADLSISMSGPARVKSKALVEYTITVTNLGPETATKISIMGGGGDQFDPVSMQCQDNGSSGQTSCQPDDLAPGASVLATYRLSVCCLFKGENRHAFVAASVGQELGPDPNLVWLQQDVFIIGGRVK